MLKMVGFVDVGGGMRGVYTCGIYDRLMDEGIKPEYCIGVSAGSANLITYMANQRGRTKRFYLDYAQRDEYMGLHLFLKKQVFFDLEYVYKTLSNSDGEDPFDFAAASSADCQFFAVATNASTGKAEYFDFSRISQDDYTVLKASCAIPLACSPIKIEGKTYFDGGIAEPIPYKKAFEDGCDKVVVALTRPIDELKKKGPDFSVLKGFNEQYPKVTEALLEMHEKYNNSLSELKELEKDGNVLIISPDDRCNVNTVTRNIQSLNKLYAKGFDDAEKIINFI